MKWPQFLSLLNSLARFQGDMSSFVGQEKAARFPPAALKCSFQSPDESRGLRPWVCGARQAAPTRFRLEPVGAAEPKAHLISLFSFRLRAMVDEQYIWATASKARFEAWRLLVSNV